MAIPIPDPQEAQWLEALGGRISADALTPSELEHLRQLQGYFQQRDLRDGQLQPSVESEARLLARVRAAAPATVASKAQEVAVAGPSLATQFVNFLKWLLPVKGQMGGRYAALAGLAMVAIVLPQLLRQPQDEAQIAKQLVPAAAQVQSLAATQPLETARQLHQALALAGVVAELIPRGKGGFLLVASITLEQRQQVQDQLKPLGLQLPVNGALQILVTGSE